MKKSKAKQTIETKKQALEFTVNELNKILETLNKNGIDVSGTNGFLIYLLGEKLLLSGRRDIFLKAIQLLVENRPDFFEDRAKPAPNKKNDDDTAH